MSSTDRRIAMASTHTRSSDEARLTQVLDSTRVIVQVPPAASPALAAAALVSMSSRVFGDIVVTRDATMPTNPWGVRTLEQVHGLHRTSGRAPGAGLTEITISFGDSAADAHWFIGGDDWTAVVSRRRSAIGPTPLGALELQAAASFAFGEVLKQVLGPLGMRCLPIQHTLVWNLLDGRLTPAPVVDRPIVARPTVAFLGGGSVGSSGIGVLAMTPVAGEAFVVDPDRFQPNRNTYRYPAVPPGHTGSKAVWGAAVLNEAGWDAH